MAGEVAVSTAAESCTIVQVAGDGRYRSVALVGIRKAIAIDPYPRD